MVRHVTGGKSLPAEVLHQVVAQTDGVPLFVEELTKTVVESGWLREVDGHYELTGPLPPPAIPATLQDSLMARLDRLATVKEVAQIGATIGREFSYELLQRVAPMAGASLQQALAKLVEAEILYQRGSGEQTRYVFKHALIQDTAYQSLRKSTRQQYHQQIAQVLTEQLAELTEAHPELLAHHYTEAGLLGQALPYWLQAGQRAVQRSANVEAISHLTKGLELLQTLPDTPTRAQQELTLQITLGSPLIATRGFAAPEVEHAYTRARELCHQVGETPQLFPVLAGLLNFYDVRGEHQTAHELGEQFLSLAQKGQDPALLLEAHHMLGCPLISLGEFASARVHFKQGIALYDPQQHRSHAFLYGGHDPGVCCLSQEALALWFVGYPDQALKRTRDALTLAHKLAHPFSLAFALSFTAELQQRCGAVQAVREQAETVITLCSEQGFPYWLAAGMILRGWALAEQGQGEEGIAQMRQGLTAYRAVGAELDQTYYLALLAEAYGKVGQVEEGLNVLAESLAAVNKTGERFYEAELYRLKGTLTLQSPVQGPQSQVEEAEACFLKAIEIARRQQAKSLELRAVMSLSRPWQQQGKREEALELLTEIYGWFTQGFDTKDLQEAKALLSELSSPTRPARRHESH